MKNLETYSKQKIQNIPMVKSSQFGDMGLNPFVLYYSMRIQWKQDQLRPYQIQCSKYSWECWHFLRTQAKMSGLIPE